MKARLAHIVGLDWADWNASNRARRYLNRAALGVSLIFVLLGGLVQLGRAEWKRIPERRTF